MSKNPYFPSVKPSRILRRAVGCLFALSVAILSLPCTHGTELTKPDENWQKNLTRPSASLRLTLTLPKTHFYKGEVIPATLVFINDSLEPYNVWMGSSDRSGRIDDIVFRAEGEDGSPVADPLKAYFEHFTFRAGGGGNYSNIGMWHIFLSANQWLRFEKPGKYKLYAEARRAYAGDADETLEKRPPAIGLVSNPVVITIEPLRPDVEQGIIRQAKQDLSGDEQTSNEAVQRLRYLQTPAAYDALLPLLDSQHNQQALLGIVSNSDWPAQMNRILRALGRGKIGLSDTLLRLYMELKVGERYRQEQKTVDGELLAAAREGMRKGHGEVFYTSLRTLYVEEPGNVEVRAMMMEHQLDLPPKVIEEFLRQGGKGVDKDFLPLLRKETKPDRHNPDALVALAKLAPDEARAIVMEDIKRDHPIYIGNGHNPVYDLYALKSLPDREIPALDPLLRQKLPEKFEDTADLETTLLLIDRYATAALLPDVIRVYQPIEGHCKCASQAAALRYWIRCDRDAGLKALGRALKHNTEHDTGCYHEVLWSVLQNAWIDEAVPLLVNAINDDEDIQEIHWAGRLLEAHAGPEAIESVVAAIERLSARPAPVKPGDRMELHYIERSLAELLIRSERWHLTEGQINRVNRVLAKIGR